MARTTLRRIIKSGNTAKIEAVKLIQGLFDNAETEDCLKEVWGILEGLRNSDVAEDLYDRRRASQIVTDIRKVLLTQMQAKTLGLVNENCYTNRPPMLDCLGLGVSNLHANTAFSIAVNMLKGAAKEQSTCLKLVS